MNVELSTERFCLRELTEKDVTERYFSWLQDVVAKEFIISAVKTEKLADIKKYVCDRIGRDDILFLGIFEKASGLHIGNIKYEPVNQILGYAIMGILIGDPAYRSKGVGTEVITASARWLNKHRNIRQILLGVSKDNIWAIKSYEKIGFEVAESSHLRKSAPEQIIMAWNISD